MSAFRRAPHYLLDARLMMAWAKAFDERGETDKARYVAARLREFRNEQADEFFAPCTARSAAAAPAPAARRLLRRRAPATPCRFQLPERRSAGAAFEEPAAPLPQCCAERAPLRAAAARATPRRPDPVPDRRLLLEHAHVADHHAAVGRLAHVVDRQQADLHGGQRLHLDAGAADGLDLRPCSAPRARALDLELDRDPGDRDRMAERHQLRRCAWRPGSRRCGRRRARRPSSRCPIRSAPASPAASG